MLSVKVKSPFSLAVSVGGLLAAFLPMLISLQLQIFTDCVQELFRDKSKLPSVLGVFAALGGLYILQAIIEFAQKYYAGEDKERIKRYMKRQLMELLSSVPYKYIENQDEFRKKVDFVKTYAAQKTAGSISAIFVWLANMISLVSISWILYRVNGWIVFALVITCVPAVILSMMQQDETYRHRTKFMKEGLLVLTYSENCRRNESMKELRFFGLYPYIKEKWKKLGAEWVEKKQAVARKHVLYNSVADILRNSVYLIVLLLAAYEIYKNPEIGLGSFMLVLSAAKQLQDATTALMTNTVSVFSDIHYMENFFELMELEKENITLEGTYYKNVEIRVDQVSFSYPNSQQNALENLSLVIKPGEKVAIVGANGSGKSTFINLLCGLYAPDSGSVRINGEHVKDHVSKVRRSISVVFQNFSKYQDTIRNNIVISAAKENHNDSEILEMMKRTGADELIENNGSLDDMIGLFSENGLNLSGGQWQKIAITRALMRKNAALYILDEPTAALDPIAEANLYRNFAELTGDKTTILVSHRLGITSVVDRILVFDRGKVVEDGSLRELLEKNGVFAEMYRAQAKWYVEAS